jgi:hypothetical protein
VAGDSLMGCTPVPLSVTVGGLMLVVIARVADLAPLDAGVKVTLMEQEVCPFRVATQVVAD